ncbi:MAG: DNA-binding protein [Elusimicrobia bacterium]|jgi:predicted DNA-binding protein with PD1-like motif|nr:DNA-binding protein [Elusimicrobiota bacterium]
MDLKKENKILAVRLYSGEDIVKNLKEAFKSTSSPVGIMISGAGMMEDVKVGYFMGRGQYKENLIDTPHEIVSCTGNFIKGEEDIEMHLHVSLADDSGKVSGGHLQKATVHGTGEYFILLSDMDIKREIEEETGLKGMKL